MTSLVRSRCKSRCAFDFCMFPLCSFPCQVFLSVTCAPTWPMPESVFGICCVIGNWKATNSVARIRSSDLESRFFLPAECWCARTIVASILTIPSLDHQKGQTGADARPHPSSNVKIAEKYCSSFRIHSENQVTVVQFFSATGQI